MTSLLSTFKFSRESWPGFNCVCLFLVGADWQTGGGQSGSGIACTSSGGKLSSAYLEAVSFVDSSSEVLVVLPFLLLVKLMPIVGIDRLPSSSWVGEPLAKTSSLSTSAPKYNWFGAMIWRPAMDSSSSPIPTCDLIGHDDSVLVMYMRHEELPSFGTFKMKPNLPGGTCKDRCVIWAG